MSPSRIYKKDSLAVYHVGSHTASGAKGVLPMATSNTPTWSSIAGIGPILFSCSILSISVMIGSNVVLPSPNATNTPPWSFTASVGSILFSCIILSMSYYRLAPRYPSAKQSAWILTTFSSTVMSLASIPFLYDYFSYGGSVKYVRTMPNLSIIVSRFFQSYLAV